MNNSIETSNECKTVLLDDLPASADAFGDADNIGPHHRVANAIADLIESEEVGGKAIGLEGNWGSGKSTVVRFLADRFSRDDNYTVVLFDAWAHEGDPLRRTFIEAIVEELCDYGWISRETWKKKLEQLSNRRKVTTTRITPKPTNLGKAMAISLLFVPLGTALLSGAFRQDITVGLGLPPNWFFCFGLYCIFAPFFVLLYRLVQLRTKVNVASPVLIPLGAMFLGQGVSEGITIGGSNPNWFFCIGLVLAIFPIVHWVWHWFRIPKKTGSANQDGSDSSSDWAFLFSRAINETETETVETPNPTSIEFDSYFSDLMEESLSESSRRLLLVLDNLDRVDSETALSIWGTLQTFLHDRDHGTENWFKQLWVVVPYDPIRIRRLWNQPEDHELENGVVTTNGTTQVGRTTESFLDKSFQVRFHVAPPVLSDWKSFLYELVEKALPGHVEERHLIYRVFDHCRTRTGDPPTPRELKLFVNQIGAIHRQWQHEFPIAHVAFFVLARRKHRHLIEKLREDGFPSQEDQRLLSKTLIDSLAGLAFNVRSEKGIELLLAEPISDAVKSDDPEDLRKIAQINGEGFWAVLEAVATTRWHDEDASGLAKISRQLHSSGLMDQHDGPEKTAVLDSLGNAGIQMKSWMPIADGLGEGLCSLFELQNNPQFSRDVLKKFLSHLAKIDASNEKGVKTNSIVETVFLLLDRLVSIGHKESLPNSVTLPFKSEQWCAACNSIASIDTQKTFWGKYKSTSKAEEISEFFVEKISTGDFTEADVIALEVTQESAMKLDWTNVLSTFESRLNANQTITSDECFQFLSALLRLESLGIEEALKTQGSLSSPGHLLHHFHQANSDANNSTKAAILLSFSGQHPDLAKPAAVGNSDAGYESLKSAVENADEDLVDELYVLAEQFDMLGDILWVFNNSETKHAIIVEVLKRIADSDKAGEVLTPEVVIEHWAILRKHFDDDNDKYRFQKLVGKLPRICDAIQSLEEGFVQSKAPLYLCIIRGANEQNEDFINWCLDGLRRMSKEMWKVDIEGNNACLAMCLDLSARQFRPELSNNFSDALQDHAKLLVKGVSKNPADWIREEWNKVLDCINGESTRKVLRERLIETAVDNDGQISDLFFQMYGSEIAEQSSLAANERTVSHLFSALVREKHIVGLKWFEQFASENSGFLESVRVEHKVDNFTDRLQTIVDEPLDHESQSIIESIAKHFGIVPKPQELDFADSKEIEGTETPNNTDIAE